MPIRLSELTAILETGETPVIVFQKSILNSLEDVRPDPGMKARLISIRKADTKEFEPYDNVSYHEIAVDLNDFEVHNRQHALREYIDGNGDYTLTWFETTFYPQNGIHQWTEEVKDEMIDQFELDEKKMNLYLVYKYGYPEDYVVLYVPEDHQLIMETYCKEAECDPMEVDYFIEKYVINKIPEIGGRKISRILFEG